MNKQQDMTLAAFLFAVCLINIGGSPGVEMLTDPGWETVNPTIRAWHVYASEEHL